MLSSSAHRQWIKPRKEITRTTIGDGEIWVRLVWLGTEQSQCLVLSLLSPSKPWLLISFLIHLTVNWWCFWRGKMRLIKIWENPSLPAILVALVWPLLFFGLVKLNPFQLTCLIIYEEFFFLNFLFICPDNDFGLTYLPGFVSLFSYLFSNPYSYLN